MGGPYHWVKKVVKNGKQTFRATRAIRDSPRTPKGKRRRKKEVKGTRRR